MIATSLPSFMPMLCTPVDVVPESADFAAEHKLDGWRALGIVENGSVVLRTREGNPITAVPYLSDALATLPDGTVLDGEIVDPTSIDGGWNRVQSVCGSPAEHVPSAEDPALIMVVFDILFLAFEDVRPRPWSERREGLEALLEDPPAGLALGEVFVPSTKLLDEALTAGFEGLVVKRRNAPYCGGRSGAWVKIKPEADESSEAQIIGFTDGKGKYAGQVGAIRFRLPSGAEGRCSGFDDTLRAAMTANPSDYVDTVVEVGHWGVTATGKLRHPNFRRLRPDRGVTEMIATALPAKAPVAPAKKLRVAKTAASKPRMRNYKSMGDAKLVGALTSLTTKSGDAYDRCLNGGSGDPSGDLSVVQALVAERGLI
jgi:bifunctional non-homologous end joining protein LigD